MKRVCLMGAVLLGACTGVISDPFPGKSGRPGASGTPGSSGTTTGSSGSGTGSTGTGGSSCGAPAEMVSFPVRRLTRAEFNATVRTLLPNIPLPDLEIPQEIDASGFENRASLQNPTAILVEDVNTAAAVVAEAAIKSLSAVVPCSASDAACGSQFVESFGARAFRRPLTDDEKKTYGDFFDAQKSAISFTAAVELTIEALLQAPAFLYRIELGDAAGATADRVPLTGYELASRLSYLLWGTNPDRELLDAAAAGRLAMAADIEAEARRMLRDPRARGAMLEFHRQWLELDRLDREADKDPTTYPSFTPALRTAMREESDRFIGDVMMNQDASLKSLLTSPNTFVNADLAKLYGVSAPASGWQAVSLPAAERAGFLTRANFLASHAHTLSGSPPLRAVFILRRLMCATLPPPPADADTSPPKNDPNAALKTNRQLFEERTVGACLGCHGSINPLGFGLENYDAIGAYRTVDNGLPVDARGEITGIDVAGPFVGGIELSQRLADSADVRTCMTRQWFEYALGRDRQASDECALAALGDALRAANGDVREMLVALTKTDAFMFRRTP